MAYLCILFILPTAWCRIMCCFIANKNEPCYCVWIAQSVQRQTWEQKVVGSSPATDDTMSESSITLPCSLNDMMYFKSSVFPLSMAYL